MAWGKMGAKTLFWCVLVAVIITAFQPDTKTSTYSESDTTLYLKATYNSQMNIHEKSRRFTENLPISVKTFVTYYEVEKQKNKIRKLDLKNGQQTNDEQYPKFRRTLSFARIRKLHTILWLALFLENTWALLISILRLATSSSRGSFMVNLTTVSMLLTFARFVATVLALFKQEWNFGETRITTQGFYRRYMVVAIISATAATVVALFKIA